MTRKRNQKPYWEMNTKELAEATAEFDKEMIIDEFKPLTQDDRARWERARSKLRAVEDQNGEQVIAVHIDKKLLERCTALAKKKHISRDCLIARGLKAVLVATGEEE